MDWSSLDSHLLLWWFKIPILRSLTGSRVLICLPHNLLCFWVIFLFKLHLSSFNSSGFCVCFVETLNFLFNPLFFSNILLISLHFLLLSALFTFQNLLLQYHFLDVLFSLLFFNIVKLCNWFSHCIRFKVWNLFLGKLVITFGYRQLMCRSKFWLLA